MGHRRNVTPTDTLHSLKGPPGRLNADLRRRIVVAGALVPVALPGNHERAERMPHIQAPAEPDTHEVPDPEGNHLLHQDHGGARPDRSADPRYVAPGMGPVEAHRSRTYTEDSKRGVPSIHVMRSDRATPASSRRK